MEKSGDGVIEDTAGPTGVRPAQPGDASRAPKPVRR